jgi:hypothetical protein
VQKTEEKRSTGWSIAGPVVSRAFDPVMAAHLREACSTASPASFVCLAIAPTGGTRCTGRCRHAGKLRPRHSFPGPGIREYLIRPKPEPRGCLRLQTPDLRPQVRQFGKQFLKPEVWSLKSLPNWSRSRREGTIAQNGAQTAPLNANRESELLAVPGSDEQASPAALAVLTATVGATGAASFALLATPAPVQRKARRGRATEVEAADAPANGCSSASARSARARSGQADCAVAAVESRARPTRSRLYLSGFGRYALQESRGLRHSDHHKCNGPRQG